VFYLHERNFGCRLIEYTFRSLRTITLENELIRITILVDKGTDIIEFLHKPTDTDFMWRSPLGVINPTAFIPTNAHPRGSFLDFYEGGWQEIMPAGGDPCIYKGIHFGIHGEVSLIPWNYKIIEDSPENVAIRFWVRTYRTPFYLEKKISLKRNEGFLTIKEKIINEGAQAIDMMWGHHPAFGPPFLDENCIIDIPQAKVLTRELDETSRTLNQDGFTWPRIVGKDEMKINLSEIPPPETKSHDWACLYDLSDGWYALTNQQRRVGFALSWPLQIFPYIWYWQCAGGCYGPPFFGRVYTMALEPWSTYPDNLTKAAEMGTTLKAHPGVELEAEIKAIAYSGFEQVSRVTPDGQVFGEQV
jgi:hypothetical protein